MCFDTKALKHEGVETQRHKGTKTRSFFDTKKMLIIGTIFQPFVRVENIQPLLEPFEHPKILKPLKPQKPLKPLPFLDPHSTASLTH